ncbi:MAG: aminotransferase class V-fold PLP-dependent enzyme [Bdellovibrionaceae bacterium]|nr:aminotransferase class V-fold PLP-dependent enzyme [Pseudobdellovibrionaceae bacterium]
MLPLRAQFNIPDSVCFLNSAFISPQMKHISETGLQSMGAKEQPWKMQPSDFFTDCDRMRELVANLMNVNADNIALVPSVSYGVETAVINLPIAPGKKILMPEGEFPSNVYPWPKSQIQFVPRPSNYDWTSAFLSAIDDTTAIVSVPQTDWSDGSHFDLLQISAKAKSVGAALILDISQSFGVSPIDIRAIDPDFVFSVGYKWQLGPYGIAYMYVADRRMASRPLENNWVNRKDSEDFTRLTEYTDDYQIGARKFDSGQHSNFALNPMAIEALKVLNELTPKQIHAHIVSLNKSLIRGLEAMKFEVVPEKFRTGHMIGAKGPTDRCVKDLCGKLREKNIYVSVRCNSLRISPHIYNTQQDIDLLLRELKNLLGAEVTALNRGPSLET